MIRRPLLPLLLLAALRCPADGIRFEVAYGAGDIGDNSAAVQDFFDLRANKGPANKDLTHVGTGGAIDAAE